MNSQLASLALLRLGRESGRDALESFLPFIIEAIRTDSEQVVALPDLQQQVRNRFGLEVPQTALKSLLKRVAKAGYIHNDGGVYRRSPKAAFTTEFVDSLAVAERDRTQIIERLVE